MNDERDRRHSRNRLIIGCFLFTLVGFAWFALLSIEIPVGNRDVFLALVSAVTGAFVMMVTYYFGSSDDPPREG